MFCLCKAVCSCKWKDREKRLSWFKKPQQCLFVCVCARLALPAQSWVHVQCISRWLWEGGEVEDYTDLKMEEYTDLKPLTMCLQNAKDSKAYHLVSVLLHFASFPAHLSGWARSLHDLIYFKLMKLVGKSLVGITKPPVNLLLVHTIEMSLDPFC